MILGVNIDHFATLREARYRGQTWGEPDPVDAARRCLAAGAEGITAHLREDRRHVQDRDIWGLKSRLAGRLNLEMGNTPEILAIALILLPDIVCIVPERRKEITTEGGLDAAGQIASLTESRRRLNDAGVDVSLFINPDPAQVDAARKIGAQCVELHTGAFAESFRADPNRDDELERLIDAARLAHQAGLRVNAGHGLNYDNVPRLYRVPHLVELNIGHSIVSRAAFDGIEPAVQAMVALCRAYSESAP